jgi:hypothetical protein
MKFFAFNRRIYGYFLFWIRILPPAVEVRNRVDAGAFPPPQPCLLRVPGEFRQSGAILSPRFSICTKSLFPQAESADRLLNWRREIASQGVPLLARRPISSEKKARFIHSVQVWSIGVLEYWSIGVLEYWSIGVLEYWSIGVLEHWSIGVLIPSP